MSSLPRRLQRRRERASADYEPKPQVTQITPKGYRTLRPTRGWVFVSYLRFAAQRRMAAMLDRVLPERRKRPAKVWRKPAPVPPGVETRQQRRWAARKG